MAASRKPPAPNVPGVTRSGIRSKAVVELKVIMRDLGYFRGRLDQFYGNDLRNAVANFQRARGLKMTGHFTQDTRDALVSVTSDNSDVPSESSSSSPSFPITDPAPGSEPSSPPTNSSPGSLGQGTTSGSSSDPESSRTSSTASGSTATPTS